MKTTTLVLDYAKTTGAVIALAVALFFGYSAIGYVTDTFHTANATVFSCGGGCGGGGGFGGFGGGGGGFYNTQLDGGGGGGGGGGITPYCTLTITQGPLQSPSYPPITQYILNWSAPYATSFSIDNGIGAVTPATGGTYTFSTSATPGVYTGTAVTPYGNVTCQTQYVPPPPPPGVCNLVITKTPDKTTANVGDIVEFTINFQNTGTAKCTGSGVWIQDTLASYFTYVSETHSSNITGGYDVSLPTLNTDTEPKVELPAYTPSTRMVEWNAYVLDPGESGWAKVKVRVGTSTSCNFTATNQAQITSLQYNWAWVKSNVATVTVNSCTPPPTPQCTLDLTQNQITWTTTNANTVTIIPLTNSPQVLGATGGGNSGSSFPHSEADAYTSSAVITDMGANGINLPSVQGNTGFASDQTTMNRVCVLMHGAGSVATQIGARSYSSPGNNRIVKYNGSSWSLIGASSFNSHLSGSFTCSGGSTITTWPLSGSFTFVPPLPVGTHTYQLTATGPGGQVQCEKTIVVPPPEECKLEITKTASVGTTTPGAQFEYTINFKNSGTKKCTGSGVKVQDILDPRLTYVSETHSSNVTAGYGPDPVYKASTRTVSFNAWDVDPNETGWIKIKVTAGTPTACSERVPNVAQITSYEYNNFGTWVTSDSVSVTINKDCTPPPPTECKLEITKSANVASSTPGGQVEYTISFKNTGTKKCTGSGVKVEDQVDALLTYVSETHSSNVTAGYGPSPVYTSSDRTLRFNAWDLDPGETGWVKWVGTFGTPDECTVTVPNTARITSYEYNNFGTWVTSNVVNVSLAKNCRGPVPYCTMSITPGSVASGGAATLTWNSTNASTAVIDQGIGSVSLSGSRTVNPTANTTYTGTFSGPGGTVTCSAAITVTTTNPTPQCTIQVSSSNINSGQSVIVSWTSSNVTQGFVTSVGTTTPVAGGSQEVYPADSTTFVGTFTGPYGSVTCQAPVTVQKGGGGCSGNCGGGLNQPNVVMLQKPPEAPLAFVTLNQIPYTGFEAGKALTLAFWLAVGLLAAACTYFVMGQSALQFVLGGVVSGAGIGRYDEYEDEDMIPRPVPNTLKPEVRRDSAAYNGNGYAASVATAPVYQPVYQAPVAAAPAVDGIPDLSDVLESRAHAAGVLMSPEAVQQALKLASDRGETLRQFGEILNEAVRTLPREDGWVMLTSDRFDDLAGVVEKPVTRATPTSTPSVEAILSSVMPPQAPTRASVNVEMPMANADDQSVVLSLAKALLAGNREQAYATLRNLEAGRANAASIMTIVAAACDQLYRARRHGLTTELSVAALDLSDEKLAQIVEVFTHGMDASYANPFTSLKLAVAQAFEVRG